MSSADHRHLPSFPTRRSSDLRDGRTRRSCRARTPPPPFLRSGGSAASGAASAARARPETGRLWAARWRWRSEEHTSELQSHSDLVCRLLLEKKKIEEQADEEQ